MKSIVSQTVQYYNWISTSSRLSWRKSNENDWLMSWGRWTRIEYVTGRQGRVAKGTGRSVGRSVGQKILSSSKARSREEVRYEFIYLYDRWSFSRTGYGRKYVRTYIAIVFLPFSPWKSFSSNTFQTRSQLLCCLLARSLARSLDPPPPSFICFLVYLVDRCVHTHRHTHSN